MCKRLTKVIFGKTRMTPLNGLRKLKIRARLHLRNSHAIKTSWSKNAQMRN